MGKNGWFSKIQTSICGIVRHWHAVFWRRFSQCFFVGCANKREYCGRLSELTIIMEPLCKSEFWKQYSMNFVRQPA